MGELLEPSELPGLFLEAPNASAAPLVSFPFQSDRLDELKLAVRSGGSGKITLVRAGRGNLVDFFEAKTPLAATVRGYLRSRGLELHTAFRALFEALFAPSPRLRNAFQAQLSGGGGLFADPGALRIMV